MHNISGVPVLHDGDLVGIVTSRDVRFETRLDATVREVMTPKERLVTVREGANKNEVRELLHKHRLEKVLIVDDKFALKGMMTVKDIEKPKPTRWPARTIKVVCVLVQQSVPVKTPVTALPLWSMPVWTWWWSTPRTVTPKA